jgi:hypothetical protein
MTVYIIENKQQPKLTDVTIYDIKLRDSQIHPVVLDEEETSLSQLKALSSLNLTAGDIVCFSGIALRSLTWNMIDIAVDKKLNLMPGQLVDHRLLPIDNGKFFRRRPQEINGHLGIPYVMLVGNPIGVLESWQVVQEIPPEEIWSNYLPDSPTIFHYLSAAAALHSSWLTPNWFPIVDMTVRDLELMPVMYATNRWEDWIAFYPANGNFKLENHTQLNPVWFDSSEKPLEYWKNE